MVKHFLYLLYFYLIGLGALEAAPYVDASIDSMNSRAHFPLQGTITITRSKDEKVDLQSFTMEGKPLAVSFLKDVRMSASADTLVSIYNFQLPAQDKGFYVLPSISVKIGGQTYHTTSSTYEVREETAATSAPADSTEPSTPLIFRLQAGIQGPSTLYPGERTKFIYRISYNRSVDLTRSVLPMIHPPHFQKVGDVQIRDYQLQDVTIQDLIQEVEASEVGYFSFGPSLIEGYAYTMQAGEKVYDSTLLKAEAPIVTIEVKPLPQPAQPASFTGALGEIQAQANLTSSDSVSVGDILQLQVAIQGVKNLTELRFPLLQCQPGFSGFFQMSDLPPLAEVQEKTKFFYVELRPLTSFVTQIPSIEVSSFNPKTGKYVIQETDSIPITVTSHAIAQPSISSIPLLIPFDSSREWPKPPLPPLEIEESIVPTLQTTGSWMKETGILWLIPIGILLLLLQKYGHQQWKQRPRIEVPKSEWLFKQALKTENLQILELAFWYRLWEKGKVPQGLMHLDKIPFDERLIPIRTFLFELQALQYSKDKNYQALQLKQNAQQLFLEI